MHRPILIATVALSLALGACQRHSQVASEAKDTGNSLSAAAKDIVHDPNIKRAGADLKAIGRDLGAEAKSSSSGLKAAGEDLAAGAKHASHDLKAKQHANDEQNRDSNG